jgi:hypothetical protein
MNTERQMGRDLIEKLGFMGAAGGGIADDPDLMARRDLRMREVTHMPEDAAHRRPETMQNAERLTHSADPLDQNKRSRT